MLENPPMESHDKATNPKRQSQRPADIDSLLCTDGILTPTNLEGQDGRKQDNESEWRPGKQEYAVMITIAVVSLMVALDATILVPVLPVCHIFSQLYHISHF